jgi:uncharacterized protein (DUF1684 family)
VLVSGKPTSEVTVYARTLTGARVLGLALLAATIVSFSLPLLAENEDSAYTKEVADWRAEREAELTKDSGWLTVAGLFWLRDGEQTVGTDTTNDFVLPEGSAPGHIGAFHFEKRTAKFRAADGIDVTQNGKPVREVVLEMGEKHALVLGNLSMWLHYSGERLAIRIRDLESPIRKDFTGLNWFSVDPTYRVTATFHPYSEPKPIEMLNILGDVERFESPGEVEFTLHGQKIRMQPVKRSNGGLWLVFRDGTSGKESYPAARFLSADAPTDDGVVTLDFNKSYNPPCTFNPHTTCPLPVKQNRLEVRIEAGEKNYNSKPHS